jgi:threonine synthase
MLNLKCKECQREYPLTALHVCEYCFGPLEVAYNYEVASKTLTRNSLKTRSLNIWRYAELLPVEQAPQAGPEVGFTPLVKADRLAKELGLNNLWIKDDTRNPTGSFKDRVVAVALRRAKELGFKIAACASTGNLANAVAAHAVKSEMEAFIFIPESLEEAKIITTAVYGCNLVAVKGNYDQVNRLCAELSSEYSNFAFVNINIRPYYAEGSKTLAFEIVEQMNWEFPDHVVVPVASGSQLTKVYKGFQELQAVGLMPPGKEIRISGAQALGCAPVAQAFENGWDFIKPVKPQTIAKSLAIGDPADGIYALDVVRKTGGAVVGVSDEEVIEGIKLLAQTEGIFTETAGGVTIATLKELAKSGVIEKDEKVIALVTGHGLKTVEALKGLVKPSYVIEPKMEAFKQAVGIEYKGD